MCASKVLPAIKKGCSPQVTFIGTKDQWRVESKKYKNLHHVSATDIYAWLDVLCDCNELFKEKGARIDRSEALRNSIADHNREIDDAAIITLDANAHAIDLQKSGNCYGEDQFLETADSSEKELNSDLLLLEACIVKGYEHHNHRNKSFSKNLHDLVKSKDENQKSSSFDDLKSEISEKVKYEKQ